MKKLVTTASAILFATMLPSTALAAEPAVGYDPADDIYIKADTGDNWTHWNYGGGDGAYSSGRHYTEYIANELTGDYDNLENYAVGGAFTGVMTGTKGENDERSNWTEPLKGWGGVQQTEKFIEDVDGEADPDALYMFSTIQNDNYAVDKIGAERAAELSSDHTLQTLKNLVNAGAKYFVISGADEAESNPQDFRGMTNKKVIDKLDDYLDQDSTPTDINVVLEDSNLRENVKKQGKEKFGYKSMGFYLISDWVPEYGYALASEDNRDILPTNRAEDIYNTGNYYSKDSKYYNPEDSGLEPNDFYKFDEYHSTERTHRHNATYYLNSDIETDDGIFKKVYNGEQSSFSKAMDEGKMPSEYSKVITFGASGMDSGHAKEVTENMVNNRDQQSISIRDMDDADSYVWYSTYVNYVLQNDISNGTDADHFSPHQRVTRADFLTMLGRANGIEDSTQDNPAETSFNDVPADAHYASHVKAAADKGYISGKNANTFNPHQLITREQMAKIIGIYAEKNHIELENDSDQTFADDAKIANYAKDYVHALSGAQILDGTGNNHFDPSANMTRASVSKVISEIVNY